MFSVLFVEAEFGNSLSTSISTPVAVNKQTIDQEMNVCVIAFAEVVQLCCLINWCSPSLLAHSIKMK